MNHWLQYSKRHLFLNEFEDILKLTEIDLDANIDMKDEKNISIRFWNTALNYASAFQDHHLKIDTTDYFPLKNCHIHVLAFSVIGQIIDKMRKN